MSIASHNNQVNAQQREDFIKALPCFATLTVSESAELASYMFEKYYAASETIVSENDLVDSVYTIVEGQAEVTHEATRRNKIIKTPVATLYAGEAIGLNDTGFFSETGQRTATVTASTTVLVLGLSIKNLNEFLQRHLHLQSAMYAASEQMLRLRLIKQSLPFHRLSHERLMHLASHVKAMSVPANTVIFAQGDEGDSSYLIRSGQVEITSVDESGAAHPLAVLTSPTLFGEATLITRAPRNATARAMDNCELLVLDHQYLSELIESEDKVADMFMTLMVDRSRPLQNPNVTEHLRTTADGQVIEILKNPDNGNYFKLSEQGQFIWQQLNGKQTMQEITLMLAEKYNVFAPDVVVALISKLAKAGFVSNITLKKEENVSAQPLWVRSLVKIRRVLEARVAIGDADKWVTNIYNKGLRLLFTRTGQAILAALAVAGIIAFGCSTGHVINLFKSIPSIWLMLAILIPCTIFSIALHELGHAFATKAFGYEVHYIGVGWYWFGPVAFTDTSDMWLSTRWPRIVVNLAGIYTDILDAGIAAILIYFIPNAYIQAFLWMFALFTYINAFRMLSPLQELDGYYVLMDLLEQPQLRQRAVVWLMKGFPKALRNPSLFRKNLPEVFYWLSCLVFLVLVSLLTVLLQTVVFKILNIHTSNPFVSLALPFLVVIISSLNIIADMRSQA